MSLESRCREWLLSRAAGNYGTQVVRLVDAQAATLERVRRVRDMCRQAGIIVADALDAALCPAPAQPSETFRPERHLTFHAPAQAERDLLLWRPDNLTPAQQAMLEKAQAATLERVRAAAESQPFGPAPAQAEPDDCRYAGSFCGDTGCSVHGIGPAPAQAVEPHTCDFFGTTVEFWRAQYEAAEARCAELEGDNKALSEAHDMWKGQWREAADRVTELEADNRRLADSVGEEVRGREAMQHERDEYYDQWQADKSTPGQAAVIKAWEFLSDEARDSAMEASRGTK